MKKSIFILAFFLLILTVLPSFAADSDFVIDENGVLTKYNGRDAEVVIPSTVNVIGENAFENNTSIRNVVIPDSVTSIGAEAFYNCDNLINVEIPNSVTFISSFAFRNCRKIQSIDLPDSITAIYEGTFDGCHNLTSVNIPDSVIEIVGDYWGENSGLGAFHDCINLSTVELPSSLTLIGGFTFSGCSSLTSIDIPESVTSIGDYAFSGCSNLTNIEIPNNVTLIGDSVFSGCSSLTSIKIPDNVTSIGDSVFSGCSSLTSVDIPESVTSIGNSVFSGCSSLISIEIPETVTSIGDSAFNECTSLTNVVLPDKITSLSAGLFSGCSGLVEITIPNLVKTLGNEAFKDCNSLSSITIPDSVTMIEDRVFEGCSSLIKLTIPDSVRWFGTWSFEGCSSLTEITIPDAVTEIVDNAFRNCSSLTEIEIPASVTSIGNHAFSGCTSLPEIEIPSSVISIGSYAFEQCRSLSHIRIPASVTEVGEDLFGSCDNLTSAGPFNSGASIEFGWTEELPKNALYGAYKVTDVILPDGLTKLGESSLRNLYSLEQISLPDSLRIIEDYAFYNSFQKGSAKSSSLVIPEGVTLIGEIVFLDDYIMDPHCDCSMINLKSITLPSSLQSIGDYSFPSSSGSECPNWYSSKDNRWYSVGDIEQRIGIADTYFSEVPERPLTTSISVKNANGTVINGKSVSWKKTNTYQFSALASPAEAYQNFTWTSSDTGIATVDSTGLVTFSKAGTVTITVNSTDGSGVKASFNFTYIPWATAISVRNQKGTVINGRNLSWKQPTYQFTASAEPAGSSQSFTWTSSDENIATVDSTGLVTFSKGGTVAITVKAKDGSNVSASFNFSYIPMTTAISVKNRNGTVINDRAVTWRSGNSYQFTAVPEPEGASDEFTWTTSNPGIAAVDPTGKVTFSRKGTVTVTVRAKDGSGVKAYFLFTYDPSAAASAITVRNGNDVVNGTSVSGNQPAFQFSASAEPSNALQLFTWTSSNTGVASVDSTGLVTFSQPGTVTVTVSANDGSGVTASFDVTYEPTIPPVTAITVKNQMGTVINGKSVSWKTSNSYQFSASAKPAGASQTFEWTSSDTDIATVDSTGLVTFSKGGTVTITVSATDGSGVTASFVFTYKPPVSAIVVRNQKGTVINDKAVTWKKSNSYQFTAAAEPEGASNEFTWETSNPGIATVDPTGLVTFSKAGTVTVTVTATDGSGVEAYFLFTCSPTVPLATSITVKNQNGTVINNKSVSWKKANSYQFTASASPEGASQSFTWTSSDTSVATVDSTGLVTFSKAGTVTVTVAAKDGSGVTASFVFTYTPWAESITVKNQNGTVINNKSVTWKKSDTYQFTATAAPEGASQSFTWTSSDTNIATLDSTGKLTIKKAGVITVTVKAKDGSGVQASFTLTCGLPTPLAESITVKNQNGTVINGKSVTWKKSNTYQFTATASPADASQSFTWTSSDANVATLDSTGKLTINKAGVITVTVAAKDGSGVQASFTLTCGLPTPLAESITVKNQNGTVINGKSVSWKTSNSYQFTATASPAEASQSLTWTSSDTSYATADSTGLVTFTKKGTVTITVSAKDGSGVQASFNFTYNPSTAATAITVKNQKGTVVNGKSVSWKSGNTYQFTASAEPSNALQYFTWMTSDQSIATVDSTGLVTFAQPGTVMVVVIANDGSGVTVSFEFTCTKGAGMTSQSIDDEPTIPRAAAAPGSYEISEDGMIIGEIEEPLSEAEKTALAELIAEETEIDPEAEELPEAEVTEVTEEAEEPTTEETEATESAEEAEEIETVEVLPVYSVTVVTDGFGTAYASASAGTEGTEVVLTAEPYEGYSFSEWRILSGSGTLDGDRFVIGSADAEIAAIFEQKDETLDEPMELTVDIFHIQNDGSRGVPFDVDETELNPTIIIKKADKDVAVAEGVELDVTGQQTRATVDVEFDKTVKDLSGSEYTVELEDLPGKVYGQTPFLPEYSLSYDAWINSEGGITVYMKWAGKSLQETEAIPVFFQEDEIGSYQDRPDGTREYLMFHTYDICMTYLGDDALCSGSNRCYHK